jgi:hypothetical protein|tara:strand:+ start:574 stop:819 length:246 start_codon:yes stop_codon:yes gene_type:complete
MQLGRVVIKGHPIYNGVVREDAVLEIPVPEELHILALDRGPDAGIKWDLMCRKLPSYGFMNPIGKMHISHLVIDGVEKEFH